MFQTTNQFWEKDALNSLNHEFFWETKPSGEGMKP